jgi:hypothetical protein
MMVAVLPLLLVVAVACDRETAPGVATTAPTGPSLQLELKPLTPLLPNRPTHVTLDSLGNIYWAQETDRGDDILFVMGEGDIPRATQLSVANIAAAMGYAGATGNLQSVAAAAGGEIFFYFSGAKGRRSLACFGQYSPKNERVRILVDGDALAGATGMGRSLALARGTVVADRGRRVWLWVRHTDAWAVFAIDMPSMPPEGPLALVRAFETVRFAGNAVELNRDEYELSPGPSQTLYWLDPMDAEVRQIDAQGTAKTVRSLVGLPSALSAPVNDRAGKLVTFAAAPTQANPLLEPKTEEQAPMKGGLDVTYPAMLIFDGKDVTAIGRDDILAYAGFPTHGMRLAQLVLHPTEDAWFTYDAGSGELLRLRVRAKPG